MRTIHRISRRYERIPSAENSSALWTHGKQRLHSPSSGVFHAVISLPMSSSPMKTLEFSRVSNTRNSVSAAIDDAVSKAREKHFQAISKHGCA
ncbi:hypothetical protein Y032_0177g618 [Ancylostoma ceylanicum]|uniref:Uncharacterized protein n=1 Tax=Ancylostoma ceylanicum TaxID=53326 RepID=A0A016SUH6_9BILA|nr:hypothetical protein Y032_0177g618 [Ancylostoma ceylanicum]